MTRRLLLLLAFAILLAPTVVLAEDEEPIPKLTDEATALEALKVFQRDYKATGFKGDERTAMREVAMRKLARTQHPLVADRLYKLTKNGNPDIRTLALLYLGYQRALPGYAGPLVVKAIKAHTKDAVFAMFGIEAIGRLDYRGDLEIVRSLMRNKDDGVRKLAILFIGDAKEWRMIEDLLKLMKDLKIDKGWKTEGHEVRYDTGASGDHDQKMAEKLYRDRYGNSAKKARGGGRAMRDMKPVLLEAMKSLTGEDFFAGMSAREWTDENAEMIKEKQKALTEQAAKQAKAAKEMME